MEKLEQRALIPEGFTIGLKQQLPLLFGVIPFGLVYGAYAVSQGVPAYIIMAFSLLINAGSSQIAAMGLLIEGTHPLLIVFSVLLINLRFILYSASLAMYMGGLSTKLKLLLSYWLTDATFMLILKRWQGSGNQGNVGFSFGVGFGQWSAWELSCLIGVLLGPIIPSSLSFDFALPLLFISLVVGYLVNLPVIMSAVASAAMAVIFLNLPNNLGLFISIVVGVGVGLLVEKYSKVHDPRKANELG